MMLARVADSLYWIGRYVERAEHLCRLSDVMLNATLDRNEAAGLVSIRAGGHLKGTVRGAHLQVEEGGGLSARVFIWPQGNPLDPGT